MSDMIMAAGGRAPTFSLAGNPQQYVYGIAPPASILIQGLTALPVWPQPAAYLIGGSRLYNGSPLLTYMKHMSTVIAAPYEGWEGSSNGTMHAYTQAAQAGSIQPAGTKVLSYYDPVVLNPNSCTTNLVANNMDLLTIYPGGSHVLTGGAHVGNLCTTGSQPTFSGRNANTYMADWAFDSLINGAALGLAQPVSANPTLDGLYADDFNPYRRYSGDWQRNGTTQAADSGNTPPGNTAASTDFRNGWATFIARWRALKSGLLAFVNLSGLYQLNSILTGMTNVVDGGVCEAATGTANSEDQFGGWQGMMNELAFQRSFCKSSATLLFSHSNVLNGGTDAYRTNTGQAWRYGLISALLAGAQYAPSPAGPQPNTTPSTNPLGDYDTQDFGSWLWPDEMSVDPTTLVAYAYGDPNISRGSGWMGTEIDGIGIVLGSSANPGVWQNGVVRKRYLMANGRQAWVLFNPSTTTAATVTYGQRMQAFSGTQVPSVNSGNNNITSESIPPLDGRIRITYP